MKEKRYEQRYAISFHPGTLNRHNFKDAIVYIVIVFLFIFIGLGIFAAAREFENGKETVTGTITNSTSEEWWYEDFYCYTIDNITHCDSDYYYNVKYTITLNGTYTFTKTIRKYITMWQYYNHDVPSSVETYVIGTCLELNGYMKAGIYTVKKIECVSSDPSNN